VLNAASALGGIGIGLVDRATSNGSGRSRADRALKLQFWYMDAMIPRPRRGC